MISTICSNHFTTLRNLVCSSDKVLGCSVPAQAQAIEIVVRAWSSRCSMMTHDVVNDVRLNTRRRTIVWLQSREGNRFTQERFSKNLNFGSRRLRLFVIKLEMRKVYRRASSVRVLRSPLDPVNHER